MASRVTFKKYLPHGVCLLWTSSTASCSALTLRSRVEGWGVLVSWWLQPPALPSLLSGIAVMICLLLLCMHCPWVCSALGPSDMRCLFWQYCSSQPVCVLLSWRWDQLHGSLCWEGSSFFMSLSFDFFIVASMLCTPWYSVVPHIVCLFMDLLLDFWDDRTFPFCSFLNALFCHTDGA